MQAERTKENNMINTAESGGRLDSIKIFDSTSLKLIAAALMLLDHIHQMFYYAGAPDWLTMLGRLVFPIFLFVSAESFHYTHSKKKYLERLLIASIGMILFTTVLQTVLPNDNIVLMNDAFSTFVVAGIYMMAWDHLRTGVCNKEIKEVGKAVLWAVIPLIGSVPMLLVGTLSGNESISTVLLKVLVTVALMIPNIMTCEGGAGMVLLGAGFYIFREHRVIQIALLIALSAVVYALGSGFQWMMVFAAVPIAMYNGKPGKGMKSFFYIYYPVHIGILYILATVLFPA